MTSVTTTIFCTRFQDSFLSVSVRRVHAVTYFPLFVQRGIRILDYWILRARKSKCLDVFLNGLVVVYRRIENVKA